MLMGLFDVQKQIGLSEFESLSRISSSFYRHLCIVIHNHAEFSTGDNSVYSPAEGGIKRCY